MHARVRVCCGRSSLFFYYFFWQASTLAFDLSKRQTLTLLERNPHHSAVQQQTMDGTTANSTSPVGSALESVAAAFHLVPYSGLSWLLASGRSHKRSGGVS